MPETLRGDFDTGESTRRGVAPLGKPRVLPRTGDGRRHVAGASATSARPGRTCQRWRRLPRSTDSRTSTTRWPSPSCPAVGYMTKSWSRDRLAASISARQREPSCASARRKCLVQRSCGRTLGGPRVVKSRPDVCVRTEVDRRDQVVTETDGSILVATCRHVRCSPEDVGEEFVPLHRRQRVDQLHSVAGPVVVGDRFSVERLHDASPRRWSCCGVHRHSRPPTVRVIMPAGASTRSPSSPGPGSRPGDSNPQPPNYKLGALPVAPGRPGVPTRGRVRWHADPS